MQSLDLTKALQLSHGGRELAAVAHLGATRWQAPAAPVTPISAWYGTGPGRIPIRCLAVDAVLSGGNVQRVPNAGGAGALFDLIAGTGSITLTDGALDLTPDEYFRFSNVASNAAPDLMGTTMFMVADMRNVTSDQYIFGIGSPQTDILLRAGGNVMRFNRRSEVTNQFETVDIPLSPAVAPVRRLYEISVSAAGPITITMNGDLRGSGSHPGWPSLRAWNFASGRNPVNATGLNTLVYDIASLVHGGEHDARRLDVRARLNELHGLGMAT